MGIDRKIIKSISRHSDVAVLERYYVKTLPEQTIRAMDQLEQLVHGAIEVVQ